MPPSAMLGASLDSMTALSLDITQTGDEIVQVSADAQSIADRVSSEITATFSAAVAEITDRTSALSERVAQAQATAENTEWTGANRDTFVGAADTFAASCREIALDAAEVLSEFDRQVAVIANAVMDFQSALQGNLALAADSAQSMVGAVDQQSQALDQTMNAGMQVG